MALLPATICPLSGMVPPRLGIFLRLGIENLRSRPPLLLIKTISQAESWENRVNENREFCQQEDLFQYTIIILQYASIILHDQGQFIT